MHNEPKPTRKPLKTSLPKPPKVWKYGSGYADQGGGGSRVRTTTKDWDEGTSSIGTSTGKSKQRTFKEFRELVEAAKSAKGVSRNDDRIEELLVIAYNATAHQSFREWLRTISKLIEKI
jgi:hypothetical protein